MSDSTAIAFSRAVTRPILSEDRGRRTDALDLAIYYDPANRTYHVNGRAAEYSEAYERRFGR